MNRRSDDVPSPCVNVCQMDPASGLCLGCLRNLDEIAGWLEFSAIEKLRVLEQLDRRRRETVAD